MFVKMSHHQTEVIARIDELEVAGSGRHLAEALESLAKDIRSLEQDLQNMTEDEMGMLPRRWDRILTEWSVDDGVG